MVPHCPRSGIFEPARPLIEMPLDETATTANVTAARRDLSTGLPFKIGFDNRQPPQI